MPFNGAGIFSRTPGTRIANQGALVSAQVNDETDNLVNGVNGKVNLDGLLTYTGLHTLFGDGTAVLHQASVQQVQKQILGHATTVGGTVDAIQLTMTPASTTLTNREKVRWTSAGANTVTAPTLSKDAGVTNKTIKKGASAALAVGDLGAAGQVNEAVYDGTDWMLQSAGGSSVSLASTTEVLTGTNTAKAVTPDALAALWEKGSDIASAGTISIGEGGTFDVTGTTTITDIDPATDKAGRTFRLVHEGIHTLTHNASTMICITGASITTAVGDISTWQSEGSDIVRMVDYVRANGTGLAGAAASQAEQEAASSTTVFTSPGRQHFHPGHVKFWASIASDGSPTLTESYNVTSISDTNVGRIGVTIANDFNTATWACVLGYEWNDTTDTSPDAIAGSLVTLNSQAAGTAEIGTRVSSTGNLQDNSGGNQLTIIGLGDLP